MNPSSAELLLSVQFKLICEDDIAPTPRLDGGASNVIALLTLEGSESPTLMKALTRYEYVVDWASWLSVYVVTLAPTTAICAQLLPINRSILNPSSKLLSVQLKLICEGDIALAVRLD